LGPYTAKGILPADPFVTIDQEGVGELVQHCGRARPSRPGPTSSSAFAASMAAIPPRSSSASETGLDYVSCSPFRVPIARLRRRRQRSAS
jgi:pyruvate, orthophosphate dikinase